jgi:hypothetical protein
MRLLIYPSNVLPEFSSYKTTTNTIIINVGFSVPARNFTNTYENRNYIVRNQAGSVIQTGIVSVKLNTFESFVTINGLSPNSFYIFTIFNEATGVIGTAVVINGSVIGIVDETTNLGTYADLLMSDSLQLVNGFLRFKTSVSFGSDSLQNSVISITASSTLGTGLYVFKPSKLFTRDRSIGVTISYMPFIGEQIYQVPVYQLATVRKVGGSKYHVDPASKMSATLTFPDGNTQTILYPSLVSLIDLGVNYYGILRMEQLFA